MPIGVAIIGPGDVARLHVDALRRAGAEVRAVAGIEASSTERFAGELGIPDAVIGADAVLRRADVDAVVIATPNPLHAQQSLAALRAGKHVLCEIPAGMSAAEARAIANASNESRRSVMVAHTLRFAEPWAQLRREVAAGRLTIRHVILRRAMMRRCNAGWSGRGRDWVDSILWHHGAHQVDLALWLVLGPTPDITDIQVHGALGAPWEENATPMDLGVVLRIGPRAMATISLSYHSAMPTEDALIIADEETYVLNGGSFRTESDGGSVLSSAEAAADADRMKTVALHNQDAEFISAIRGQRAPASSIHDVQATMAALELLTQPR